MQTDADLVQRGSGGSTWADHRGKQAYTCSLNRDCLTPAVRGVFLLTEFDHHHLRDDGRPPVMHDDDVSVFVPEDSFGEIKIRLGRNG